MAEPELSYCVVNTAKRDLLVRALDSIARERARLPFASEVLVLDNCSGDGSLQAARGHPAVDEVIALARRRGKALNDSELLRRARGRFALLMNEDTELQPGATVTLHEALAQRAHTALAGARLVRPDGAPQACAWRFPSPLTAAAGALLLHRVFTVQSHGSLTREVDFARRLRDAGWRSVYVPAAVAVHHEQLATGRLARRRIVELSRNRDLYMRKHHSAAAARLVRWLTAWSYALRALGAVALPGHDPGRYWQHVSATLMPGRGEGLRELAEEYNRSLQPVS